MKFSLRLSELMPSCMVRMEWWLVREMAKPKASVKVTALHPFEWEW